jgi:hypothetical protein
MSEKPSFLTRRGVLALSAAAGVAVASVVLGGRAISAQDKYTVQVPGGLAFSEFRGYEAWQVVSISRDGPLMAAILANPVMIDAYLAGVPGNGQPFPDGAKMAKVHWTPKMMEIFPAATVPGLQHDVDFMVKDGKRFADMPCSSMTLHPIRSGLATRLTLRRRKTMPSAGSRATRSRRQEITFSRITGADEARLIKPARRRAGSSRMHLKSMPPRLAQLSSNDGSADWDTATRESRRP